MSIYKPKLPDCDDSDDYDLWSNGLYYYEYDGSSEKLAYYDEEVFSEDSYGCAENQQENVVAVGFVPDAEMKLDLFAKSGDVPKAFNTIMKEFDYNMFLELARKVQKVERNSNIPIKAKKT